ncbi:MAG: cell division protein [Rhodospirillales bacterium]|nr:cell division protein [Rhodospirillales bacterium]
MIGRLITLRSDLPFGEDDLARFLPWLVAFMVFLSALAIAGIFGLANVAEKWNRGVKDTLTIQLPRAENLAADSRRLSAALGTLRRTEGVKRADAVDREIVQKLLAPWLGGAVQSKELPLPQVIDVEIDRSSGLSAVDLQTKLKTSLPRATVDDHRVWLDGFVRAVNSTELVAGVILVVIFLATIGTVVFSTRTGLGLHRDVIEVMHLMGAQDSYIAKQFADRFLFMGLRGGLAGMALALPILFLLKFLAGQLQAGLLPATALGPPGWSAIAALVPVVALIAMVTARMTVIRALAKMF